MWQLDKSAGQSATRGLSSDSEFRHEWIRTTHLVTVAALFRVTLLITLHEAVRVPPYLLSASAVQVWSVIICARKWFLGCS